MRTNRWASLGLIAGSLLWLACDHVSSTGGPDAGDDTETAEPECASQGADDIGGGCPPGYYCDDNECERDCITDEECVQSHGQYWGCNQFGQCVFEDVGSDA